MRASQLIVSLAKASLYLNSQDCCSLQVVANFGGSSFTCDVSSLEADAAQCIQDEVQQTQVPFDVKVD